MTNLDEELYWLECENEYQEVLTDAALSIMITYCIRYKLKINDIRCILSQYLENDDLFITDQTDVRELSPVEIEHILKIIDISKTLRHGYYVYELFNPISGKVFYVGKGIDNRICDHELYMKNRKGHYNEQLNNAIQHIYDNGSKIKYRIVDADISEEEALKLESQLIEKYGIHNLCNQRVTGTYYNSDDSIKHLLLSTISNYESWCFTNIKSGRYHIQDRLTYLTILLSAYKLNTLTNIGISIRDIAEKMGVSFPTSAKSLKRLENAGLISRTFRGKASYSSKYSLITDRLHSDADTSDLTKCIKIDQIIAALRHDAFRLTGLGNTGFFIYMLMLRNPGRTFTTNDIRVLLGCSYITVSRALKRLVHSGIITYNEHKYSLKADYSLDKASHAYNTVGIGARHAILHKYQRNAYRYMVLSKQVPQDYPLHPAYYLVEQIVSAFDAYMSEHIGLLALHIPIRIVV